MCSIAGHTGRDLPGVLPSFCESMHHRGPDYKGEFHDEQVHLCMTRLAIVDPEFGSQPMQSSDGHTVLIFNGELYNHIELREELFELGHSFGTTSDTEVFKSKGFKLDQGVSPIFS